MKLSIALVGLLSQTSNTITVWSQETEQKECDPVSWDSDSLICGQGQKCQFNANSYLGGVCIATTTSISSSSRNSIRRSSTSSKSGRNAHSRTIAIAKVKAVMREHMITNNDASSSKKLVECNPRREEFADVGILTCASNEHCLMNDASSAGGFCIPVVESTTTSTAASSFVGDEEGKHRQLYSVNLCNPTNPVLAEYGFECNCDDLDRDTETGSINCIGESYTFTYIPGCEDLTSTVEVSYSFSAGEVFESTTCYILDGQKSCISYNSEEGACEVSFNDEECMSCIITSSYTYEFDCSNVDGAISGTAPEESRASDFVPAINACYVPPCRDFCGRGLSIPMENFNTTVVLGGDTELTCADLVVLDEEERVPQDVCFEFKTKAVEECCPEESTLPPITESPTVAPEPCDLCTNGELLNMVNSECLSLLGLAETNATSCDEWTFEAEANSCCMLTTEPSLSPSMVPASSPMMETMDGTEAPTVTPVAAPTPTSTNPTSASIMVSTTSSAITTAVLISCISVWGLLF